MRALPLCLAFLLVPAVATAQGERERGYLFQAPRATLSLYGGLVSPTTQSDLWQFTFDQFTLGRRDFLGFNRGVDLALAVGSRFDVVISFANDAQSRQSESRDYVDQDDQPIQQRTELVRSAFGLGLRYSVLDKGRRIGSLSWIPARVVPHVGVSTGFLYYRFQQQGDFVDAETLEIFPDFYRSVGRTGYVRGEIGTGFTISPSLVLNTELRYLRAQGSVEPTFTGFQPLDLSGVTATLGFTIRL